MIATRQIGNPFLLVQQILILIKALEKLENLSTYFQYIRE